MIFIESETLYAVKGEVPEDPEFTIPLGKAAIRREGTDVTVVAYMGMMYRALEAAEELAKEGISIEIVDPRTLRPLDIGDDHRVGAQDPPRGGGGGGGRLRRHGLGDRRRHHREAFDDLDAPGGARDRRPAPMPYARNLEKAKTPSQGAHHRSRAPRLLRQRRREELRWPSPRCVMPKLSEAMESGKIIKWLKKEGDRVQAGDILAEVETDKADVEMEAFGSGVLRKILIAGR